MMKSLLFFRLKVREWGRRMFAHLLPIFSIFVHQNWFILCIRSGIKDARMKQVINFIGFFEINLKQLESAVVVSLPAPPI